MKEKTFSRKELYGLVWEQPMTKLAMSFNIEPQRLKEICIDNDIPLPSSGYWSKLRFNKKVVKRPLSSLEDNDSKVSLNPVKKIKKFKAEYLERAYELEQQSNLQFEVPKRVVKYHPLIQQTQKLLKQLDESKKNVRFWDLAREYAMLPIHTDSKLRSRAFRFMNSFIQIVEAMNGSIVFEYGRCHVQMFGQKTEINLRQKYHRIRRKDNSGLSTESWEKTYKLEFQAGPSFSQKNWIDKKTTCLEEYLSQIIAWIEKDCKYWHDLRALQAIESNKRALREQKQKMIMEAK